MKWDWKIVGCLLGIFLAGAVSGSLLTLGFLKKAVQNHFLLETASTRYSEQLKKELDLQGEQAADVQERINQTREELRRIRRQVLIRSAQTMQQAQSEIATQLTPEQTEKFNRFNETRRERFRRFFNAPTEIHESDTTPVK